jgi:hypothetical protein
MCKTNWSRKGTDKLQELFIKTDKKSKLTKFKEKVKLTNGNGQGTCVQNTNVDGKKEKKKKKTRQLDVPILLQAE